jgi:hypothetical protein
MYGPLSADLANARMADRHRQAAQVGLENSIRRSRPAPRRISWSGQSIAAIAGALVAGLRSAAVRPRVSRSLN